MTNARAALDALKTIAAIGGNLPDESLTDRTGPNDAAARGIMYVTAREIARAAIAKIEADPPPSEPLPRLAIILEGGIVQDVVSDHPDLIKLESLYVIDYDTEGADVDDLLPVPQGGGGTADAAIYQPNITRAEIDLAGMEAEEDAKANATEAGWRRATWEEIDQGFFRFQHRDGMQSDAADWRALLTTEELGA